MQQVNFYLPEFQPNREAFRSSQIIILILVVMLFLVGITYLSVSDNKAMSKRLEAETLQNQGLKDKLQQFANSKVQVNILELDNKVTQIKNEITRRQQLLQVISYQRLGNDQGFSAQLETMARKSNSQISLEIFSIKQGGSYVELVGKTTSADKLPAYITSLKSDAVFRDVSFGVVDIKPVDKSSGQLQFVVAEPERTAKGEQISAVQVYLKETESNKGALP